MKVSTRLALGFGMAVTLGISIAVLGVLEMRNLAAQVEDLVTNRMVKVQQFSSIKDNLNASARYVRNIVIDPDPASTAVENKRIADVRADNQRLFDALDKSIVIPKGQALLKTIQENRGAYNAAIDSIIALDTQGKAEEARQMIVGELRTRQASLFKAVDDSIEFQREVANRLAQEASQTARYNAALLLALAAVMAVVGALVGWALTRSLKRALGAEPAEVSAAVQRVADGELSTEVVLRAGDSTSTMAAVHRMQQSLTGIVGDVRGNAESVATASAQISQGNHDLSQRTEEQASALQQTAATMDQLGSTVRNNADNARQANQLALNAAEVAVRGGEVVGRVVGTMKSINDSSKKVAEIIGTIDSIAFQTNILALNAAVEAARAGEQGRGFAVVAAEVRSLAQRSAEAAKEIKTLIGSSVEQVDQGTTLVDQAGRTMEEIVGAIKRVSDMVGEISAASSEQSAGVSQVGQAISQMDQVTQQNAALVEESAAAAESLKQQARQLVDTVAVFKLAADGRALLPPPPKAVYRSPASPKPAATPVERREGQRATNVVRPAFKAATSPAVAVPASAARPEASAKTGTDDWESF